MRCISTSLGERCSLEHAHGPLHMAASGRTWSELELTDYEDGFECPIEREEDDPEGHITNAIQYYTPFSHVVVTRKKITRLQRNCRRCRRHRPRHAYR